MRREMMRMRMRMMRITRKRRMRTIEERDKGNEDNENSKGIYATRNERRGTTGVDYRRAMNE